MTKNLIIPIILACILLVSSCKKNANTSCGTPTGLSSRASYFSAFMNWDSVMGVQSYNVRYRKLGSTVWTTTPSVTSNWNEIAGFDSTTNYEWQVQSVCANGSSGFSISNTFNTGTPVAYWTFSGTTTLGAYIDTHVATNTIIIGDGITSFNYYNDLQLTFSKYPMSSAVYKVTGAIDSTINSMTISHEPYISTGNDNVSVNVQVINGKIHFYIPCVEVKSGSYVRDITNITVNQQ